MSRNKPLKHPEDYYRLLVGQPFFMSEVWFNNGEVTVNIHKCIKLSNTEFEAHDYYEDPGVSIYRIHNRIERDFMDNWNSGNSYFYYERPEVKVVHCDENSPEPIFINPNFLKS